MAPKNPTSKKRPRSGKQASSSIPRFPPYENLPYFFLSEEELTHFREKFEERAIVPIRYLDYPYIEHFEDEHVHSSLQEGHWYGFLNKSHDYVNETLVKLFYSNLKEDEEGHLHTVINDKYIYLTPPMLHDLTNLQGPTEPEVKIPKFDEVEFLTSLGVSFPRGNKRPTITGMLPHYRALFYVITYILKPRRHSHTTITHQDAQLMYCILKQVNFDWCKFLGINMLEATEKEDHDLPYPFLVMRICAHHGFDVSKGILITEVQNWEISDKTFRKQPSAQASSSSAPPPILSIQGSKVSNRDLANSLNAISHSLNILHTTSADHGAKIANLSTRMDRMATFMNRQYGYEEDASQSEEEENDEEEEDGNDDDQSPDF